MFYRLYSLECADGVYIGVKVSDTEIDSMSLTATSALRYYLKCNKNHNTYVKLSRAINKYGFRGFTIKYDNNIYDSKDEAYVRMSEIQKKIPNLLNDFIMSNDKVKCECGHNVRQEYLEQHKLKYCILNSTKNNTQHSVFE